MIELEVGRPVCIELYKNFKDLGRFMLRYGGSTIAAGLITEVAVVFYYLSYYCFKYINMLCSLLLFFQIKDSKASKQE